MDFAAWIGRSQGVDQFIEPTRTNALRASLGDTVPLVPGDALPLLHHWLYFWDVQPADQLGADGHPARGGFLPPIPLPRRMWAGGQVEFRAPLRIGDTVTRTSTILNVEAKTGRSGDLIFVTVEHRLSNAMGIAIVEKQDIVYREAAGGGSHAIPEGQAIAPSTPWSRKVDPDPVLLFRYSALTMNGHRIHYDRNYALEEEAYPALVVQGPLQATLLIDLAARQLAAPIKMFDYRGQVPAFEGHVLHICGEPIDAGARLWAEQQGGKTMIATAKTP